MTGVAPAAGGSGFGPTLPRSFFAREPDTVARDLIGTVLVTVGAPRIAVRVIEVEAYHGERDPASHAFRGRTARTAVMFGPPGFLYVYFVYGMHWCANIVTGSDGEASAVLLRGGEVLAGVDAARLRRTSPRGAAPRRDVDLARGPAVLATVLGLTGENTGADLCRPAAPFRVHAGSGDSTVVHTGPRVGVAAAGDVPWRFFDADSPAVSSYRAGGRKRTR